MGVEFNKYKSDNVFINSLVSRAGEGASVPQQQPIQDGNPSSVSSNSSSARRMNDYDSSLLEENAYLDINNEMLKIEHKLGVLDSALRKIDGEIHALRASGALWQIDELNTRKSQIIAQIKALNKSYVDMSIGAKVSGHISSAVTFTSSAKSAVFDNVKNFLSRKVLTKISKNYKKKLEMQDALTDLNNINDSVGALVKSNVPFGETFGRYEKLTAYLNKANEIQVRLSPEEKKSI